MPSLKTIIERNDTRWGRVFDLFIQSLILATDNVYGMNQDPSVAGGSIRMTLGYDLYAVFTVLGCCA